MIFVFTGNGKGKTTAAMGQLLRALGHGWHGAVLQFIKNRESGESAALKQFGDQVVFETLGAGFTWQGNADSHALMAQQAWQRAESFIDDPRYRILVFDELTYVMNNNYVAPEIILAALDRIPQERHVLITGRDASAELTARADMVSEIMERKHYYTRGVSAQEGSEF